jgi:hypothetical protein
MEFGMVSKFKYVLFFFLISLLCGGGVALGACVGGKAVWGTDDDRVSCARKQQLKAAKKELKIEQEENEIAEARRRLYDSKAHPGQDRPNVILGSLAGMLGGEEKENVKSEIVLTKHQARVEWMPYLIPGAAQFDEPGTPENMFLNGFAWEYHLNPNLGFGLLFQRYHKSGGKDFDPIVNNLNVAARDATADYQSRPVLFPGAIESVTYTHLFPYVTFNTQIGSPLWHAICRFGIGMTQADIKYKSIDKSKYPYARQPSDVSRSDNGSLLFDIGIERWSANVKYGGALRYINARHDAANYNEYFNMSSAQVLIYAQWMIRPLGLL